MEGISRRSHFEGQETAEPTKSVRTIRMEVGATVNQKDHSKRTLHQMAEHLTEKFENFKYREGDTMKDHLSRWSKIMQNMEHLRITPPDGRTFVTLYESLPYAARRSVGGIIVQKFSISDLIGTLMILDKLEGDMAISDTASNCSVPEVEILTPSMDEDAVDAPPVKRTVKFKDDSK